MADYRLKLENKKQDSAKVTYRIQRGEPRPSKLGGMSWRMTLWRLEWFPKLKTWRLIETRREPHKKTGQGYWRQIPHAEFGDIPENVACDLALSTAILYGIDNGN